MFSFITQHNATDVVSFEGACNWHVDCRKVNALTQIPFNGTNFINAVCIFCLTHGPTVFGEMEMNSVANLATLQTPLAIFSVQKSAQTLFSS